MRIILSRILVFLLALLSFTFVLTGCAPNQAYFESKKQGYFPTAYDYPFTKWVCREKNLYFCMWPNSFAMTGEYVSDEETLGLDASCLYNRLDFTLFRPEDKTESEHKDANGVPFYRYTEAYEEEERVRVETFYEYHDGIMTCTVFYSEHEDFRQNEVFTFENAGKVTQSPEARWRCQELDLYLDSYEGVDFFYAGELTKEGAAYTVWATRHDINGKFDILTNGKVSDTVSCYLECAYIECDGDTMVWQITDAAQRFPDRFNFWDYPGATLTFVREPLP